MTANSFRGIVHNQNGMVLVVSLLLLLILSILGIATIDTSVMEMQISANNKFNRQAFTQADGGTQAGGMLLEENIACPTGFEGYAPLQIGLAQITGDKLPGKGLNFWINETEPVNPYPSDTERHIRIPSNDNVPHTNLHFFGNSGLSTGNAIQMIAGYEGIGYAAAAGGGQLVTNIDSQHIGEANSVSSVRLHWRHIIGLEGTCNY